MKIVTHIGTPIEKERCYNIHYHLEKDEKDDDRDVSLCISIPELGVHNVTLLYFTKNGELILNGFPENNDAYERFMKLFSFTEYDYPMSPNKTINRLSVYSVFDGMLNAAKIRNHKKSRRSTQDRR